MFKDTSFKADFQAVGSPDFSGQKTEKSGGSLLGSNDKIGSQTARGLRFLLQHAAGDVLPGERVAWCNKRALPNAEFIAVFHSETRKRAHYANLRQCCQIWLCPVCAYKISIERRNELKAGFGRYKEAGRNVYIMNFTLQHSLDDPLSRVLNDLLKSVKETFKHRWWPEVKGDYKIQGMATVLESRWGDVNGWHPHKHIALLMDHKLNDGEKKELSTLISSHYAAQVARCGGYVNTGIGFDFEDETDEGEYLTKWGIDSELSRGSMKKGKSGSLTPFDLLLWSTLEYNQPAALFKEFWQAFKGCRQLVLHKGTKKLLGITEKSDRDLLNLSPDDDELIIQVALDVWKQVCRMKKRGELLNVVENGGLEAAERLLRGLFEDKEKR